MTLEQLRIFVAVAERQHVTRAAADLNLTQSAVSAAISTLEARHDVKLFDRVGRGVVLNPVGEAFLAEARAVLARAAAAEASLADLSGLKRGRLSVYASQTIASYWLPARLARYHRTYPGVDIEVAIGNTAEVAKAVADGLAEFGLVEGEVDDPALSRRTVGHDQLVVVVGRDHAWASRDSVAAAELAQSPWVLREPGSGTRSAFVAAVQAMGEDPDLLPVALTLPANEAVLNAVEAGAGATAISASVAAAGLRAGTLVQLAFDLPSRPYALLRHKARHHSKAADAFLALIGTTADG
jgi:DNA-binding transcriptional LysR family regulator